MKLLIQRVLQKVLGFPLYLNVFSIFKILTLKWDKKENDFFLFLSLIKNPGSTLLDIGANIGIMTYYLSKKAGINGRVHSFEPNPENLNVLKKNVTRFQLSNVSVHGYGLGRAEEKRQLIMPVINHVRMQGLSFIADKSNEMNTGTLFSIEVKRLDDISTILNSDLPLEAIKIDVENFEFAVLEGSIKTITKFRPVIYCELWENDNRMNSINFLSDLNFMTFISEKGKLIKYSGQQNQNFFFIPQEKLFLAE